MASIVAGMATGEVVDWTNNTGGTLHEGAIVTIGPLVGILVSGGNGGLQDGEVGTIRLEGLARFPKKSGTIAKGATVDLDVSEDDVTSGLTAQDGSGDITGFAVAVEQAESADAEVTVRLTPGRGVVH